MFLGLNNSQWGSLARTLLGYAGVFAVGRGWVTTQEAANFSTVLVENWPAVLAVAAAIWGIAKRSDSSLVQSVIKLTQDPDKAANIEPAKLVELASALPVEAILPRINNDMVKLANADPSNDTTAVVTTPAAAAAEANADRAKGLVP